MSNQSDESWRQQVNEDGLSIPGIRDGDELRPGGYDVAWPAEHVSQEAARGVTYWAHPAHEGDEGVEDDWSAEEGYAAATGAETLLDERTEKSSPSGYASASDNAALASEQHVRENYGTIIGVLQETVRRMVDSHELPPQYVDACLETFVAPINADTLQYRVREHRVIVLPGPRGSGRHSCAVWLLHNIGGLRLREVRREPGDTFLVDDLASERRIGWLLDLRADGDQVQLNLGRALITSSQLLETASSYLAVAIRTDLWEEVKAGGEDVAVPLKPANSVEIVRRHLLRGKPALSESDAARWLEYPDVVERLEPLPPVEAVEWAQAIRDEHFTPLRPGAFSAQPDELTDEVLKDKVSNVIKARSDWRSDLLQWNKDHPDGRTRNFMLAAAVLEGSAGEEVFTAAEELAKILKFDSSEPRGLSGPGILELVSEVKAHLSMEEAVYFDRAGYADAVLEYFWADRMHLREAFMTWMNALALSRRGDVANSLVERLGQYVLRWSIRRNKLDSLEDLITAWVGNRSFIPAAEALITAAGLDPVLGRPVRERMLAWSRSDQEEANPLKFIIARACGGPLGKLYPKVMLLRLGYAAGTDNVEVAEAVKYAVRSLWELPKARDRIRNDITSWYGSNDSVKRRAARRTFATLAGLTNTVDGRPLLLASTAEGMRVSQPSDEPKSFLVEGWRSILDEPVPNDETIGAFTQWMDAALHSSFVQEALWQIFADAVYKLGDEDFNDRRYSTLSDLLYTWQPTVRESSNRAAARESLLSHIRKLDPLRHPPVASQSAGEFTE
jgi:hypothetical protein